MIIWNLDYLVTVKNKDFPCPGLGLGNFSKEFYQTFKSLCYKLFPKIEKEGKASNSVERLSIRPDNGQITCRDRTLTYNV